MPVFINGIEQGNTGNIAFPAIQVPSADANTLDDYEEGTFTAGIADDSLNGSNESQVYSVQIGRYTKIGVRVFCFIRITITDLGCLSTCQGARIVGLPFTSANVTNVAGALYIGFAQSLSITANQVVTGSISTNATNAPLRLWDATGGTSSLLLSELSDGGDLLLNLYYEA